MEEKKLNKRNFVLIIIGILATIVITLGISYAYWRLTKEQTNENVVNTACLDFEIANEQDDILLKNAFPISNREGYELTPYKFTIRNKCQDSSIYQINLEMLEGSDLSTNYIKYVLNEITEEYVIEFEQLISDSYDTLEECQIDKDDYESWGSIITKNCQLEGNQYVLEYKDNFITKYDTNDECQSDLIQFQDYTITKECVKEKIEPSYEDIYPSILGEEYDEDEFVLDNAIEGKKLANGILLPMESKDFTLRLWIDEDVKVEDDAMNKTLLSKVTVSSNYLEERLLIPTVELSLSVCDKDITAAGSGKAKFDREISKYEYKIDEGDWQEGSSYQEFLNQDVGMHQVSVRVTDNKNSVSKEVTKEIEIVNSGPPEMVEIAGMQIPISTCKNGLYKVEHNNLTELSEPGWEKEEYRFAGVDYTDAETSYVHNYVEFNNEKWRIIGLVNVKTATGVEQRVKIIRTDGVEDQKDFGEYSWNFYDNGIEDYYKSNWVEATLKNMLNGIYYNSESGECYKFESVTNCDFSGEGEEPKGLDDTAKQMIDSEVIWNIGGWDTSEVIADTMYEIERGTITPQDEITMEYYPAEWTKENDATYHKGIGLMYPSDYGYAVGGKGRNICLENPLSNYNENSCYENNWLKKVGWFNWSWFITPYSASYGGAFHITYDGSVGADNAINNSYIVWPVSYLSKNVTITGGTGEINNPYKLTFN